MVEGEGSVAATRGTGSRLTTGVWMVAAVTFFAAILATLKPMDVYGPFKMTASTGFIATAVLAGGLHTTYGRLLLAGLICSWWGDLLLLGSGRLYFLSGLVSFLLGHVFYSGAFYAHGSRIGQALAWLVALTIPAYIIMSLAWPNVPAMLRIPVVAYMSIISIMLALALGAWRLPGGSMIAAGAIAFYLSDVCVARGRFISQSPINGLIGLPLYFLGQVILAISVAYATGAAKRFMRGETGDVQQQDTMN
ncbi:MAG: lysoplasmalogenase [Candidatus Hydrogenedentes bacterium]|nr:lysoplasmalogenase [Candidatus Hydrogenedentota bacterium]